jgi:hypothetical protein
MSDPKTSTEEPIEEPVLMGRPPDEADIAWRAWLRKTQEEAPQRLEETAKYLSGLISLCFTIFLSVNKEVFKDLEKAWQVNWAVPLWLLSVVMTLFVLLPLPYGLNADSASSIERALKRITRVKFWILVVAIVFFISALALLAGLYRYAVK